MIPTVSSRSPRPCAFPAAQMVTTRSGDDLKIDATGKCDLVVAIGTLSMHYSNRPFLLRVAPRDASGAISTTGKTLCMAPADHFARRRAATRDGRRADGGARIPRRHRRVRELHSPPL